MIKKFSKIKKQLGFLYALKKSCLYIYNFKKYKRVDFFHKIFAIIIGKSALLNYLFKIYNFRLRYGLFIQKSKPLWLGKNLNHKYLQPIWINPREIRYQIKSGEVPFIQDGDWDLNKTPFLINDAIEELYVKDPPISVEETSQFKLMMNQINKGIITRGCSSKSDVLQYFNNMNILFEDLKKGKYFIQNELKNKTFIDSRYPNEIIVSLDRNGKYLHERGGSHRLSMAKILNMPLVPVVIIRKHFKTYVKENNYNDNPF